MISGTASTIHAVGVNTYVADLESHERGPALARTTAVAGAQFIRCRRTHSGANWKSDKLTQWTDCH